MAESTPQRGSKRKTDSDHSNRGVGKRRKTVDNTDGYKCIPYKEVKKGFFNLYNTCYIGSALQVLAMDSELLQMVMRLPSENVNPGTKNKVLALQVALLCCIKEKATRKTNIAAMENFCQIFEVNEERTGDASEILQTFLQLIEEETKGTNLEPQYQRFFCSRDGNSVLQPTIKFVDGGSSDLEQALSQEEDKGMDSPKLQIICVNRLKYLEHEREIVRLNEKFSFPAEFSSDMLYGENKSFTLKAVIAHQYKENFPHYTVHVRMTDLQRVDIDRAISKPVITVPKSNPKPEKPPQKKGGRASRCKICVNCKAKECGECKFCKDKPKYGGKNVLKKACSERQCLGLSEKKEPTKSMLDYVIKEEPSVSSEQSDSKEADGSSWLHYDDVTVEEESITKVLKLAGDPNGPEDQALATVAIYASHNTAPATQIEVASHILEAFDGLTTSPATTNPGCTMKILDPNHIFKNCTWNLINQESMVNMKFEINSEELDELVVMNLGSKMHIKPNNLKLYKRLENDVERFSISTHSTFRDLFPKDLAEDVVPEIKVVFEIKVDDSNHTKDENEKSFPVAVKLFDAVNKNFLLYSLDRVNPNESVKDILNDDHKSSVGILVDEKLVTLDPDTLFHSVFQMAGDYIPVLLVQKKANQEVENQERVGDYVARRLNSIDVILKINKDEIRTTIFVGAEIDQVYNQIGEAVQHPGDKLQLSVYDNSALSSHTVSDLKKTLFKMKNNQIPRILRVRKLDMKLIDFLNKKIPYTFEVLQMTSLFTEMMTTDIELDDGDLTVDQLTKVITENLKENMPTDSVIHLVTIRSRKITSILSPQARVADHVELKPGKIVELVAIILPADSQGKRLISCFTFVNKFYNMEGYPGLLVLPEELHVSRSEIMNYIRSRVKCSKFECRKPTNAPAEFEDCTPEQFCPVLRKEGTKFETIVCIQL